MEYLGNLAIFRFLRWKKMEFPIQCASVTVSGMRSGETGKHQSHHRENM